jgi:hypothetical protein
MNHWVLKNMDRRNLFSKPSDVKGIPLHPYFKKGILNNRTSAGCLKCQSINILVSSHVPTLNRVELINIRTWIDNVIFPCNGEPRRKK